MQLAAGAGVHAEVARPAVGRRGDAQVDLGRAGLPQHGHHGPGARAPHDGVVDHDQALAGDVLPDRVELHAHALAALVLAGGDERAADVAVPHQPLAERDAAAAGVALGGGDARLGHRHDHGLAVEPGRCRAGSGACSASDSPMRWRAVCTVWPYRRLSGRAKYTNSNRHSLGSMRSAANGRSDRVPVASITTISPGSSSRTKWAPDDVEAGRLRREHPAVVEPAQAQGAEPVGVAHADDVGVVHQHEGEGALELGQDLDEGPLQVPPVAARPRSGRHHGVLEQLGHHVAVAADRAGQDARLVGQVRGVDQVAVVAEDEAGVAGLPVDGLGVAPGAGPGRGVADVADGEMALERRQRAAVEDVGDQAHVLDDGDGVAVADRHAGRLLAPVLQGVQAQVGQLGDGLARGVDAEDAAGLLWLVVVAASTCGGVDLHCPIFRTGPRVVAPAQSIELELATAGRRSTPPPRRPRPGRPARRPSAGRLRHDRAAAAARRRPPPAASTSATCRGARTPRPATAPRRTARRGRPRRRTSNPVPDRTAISARARPRPPSLTSWTTVDQPSATRPRTSSHDAAWAAVSSAGSAPPRWPWAVSAHREPASVGRRRRRARAAGRRRRGRRRAAGARARRSRPSTPITGVGSMSTPSD